MDLICPHCAEPLDNDELHDIADEQGTSYSAVLAAFRRDGCEAIDGMRHNPETMGSFKAQAASAMFDLMPDDPDGVAAMMEDFF